MSRKDIIAMARQAGFTQGIEELTAEEFAVAGVWVQDTEITELLERFADLVAAAAIKNAPDYKMGYADGVAVEREEILVMSSQQWFKTQADYDAAIRARGNK